MNISKLARILTVTPEELKEKLPELGFHIGKKAIQIPDEQAEKVIKKWQEIKKEEERKKGVEREITEKEEKKEEIKEVFLPGSIQVYRLAEKLNLPLNKVMVELVKNGVLVGLNEEIDYEIAAIVAENLGFRIKRQEKEEKIEVSAKEKIKEIIAGEEKEKLTKRPPVIVVMGHVDHGKSSLLDALRKTKVTLEEKGGITQKIGAYQVKKNNRLLTFIDTPGHEAFETMRERGGSVADLAILVIAADDRVQPQTLEAIKIISKEDLPYLVALNKIDKPEANVEKIKKELSEINLVPEDWGGKVICLPVSAKTAQGLDLLLEDLLLLADLYGERLLANEEGEPVATVIESHLSSGLGPVATVIVFNGFLKKGDQVIIGSSFGKIKMMIDEKGEEISKTSLSQPVRISGLKKIPQAGEILERIEGGREFKKRIREIEALSIREKIKKESRQKEEKKIKLILKAESLGSLEALEGAVKKIADNEVHLEIVKAEVGQPTETEIVLAQKINAQILSFNIGLTTPVKKLADESDVKYFSSEIIYRITDYLKKEVESLKEPKFTEEKRGKLQILAIFGKRKEDQILGGRMLEGEIKSNLKAKIWRNEELIGRGLVKNLQINRENVSLVRSGLECGLLFESEVELIEGDLLEIYEEKKII